MEEEGRRVGQRDDREEARDLSVRGTQFTIVDLDLEMEEGGYETRNAVTFRSLE